MASHYADRIPQLRPLRNAAPGTLTTPARSGAVAFPSPRISQKQTGTSLSRLTTLPLHADPDAWGDAASGLPPAPAREAGEEDAATEETAAAAPNDAANPSLPRGRTMGDYTIQRCDGLRTLVINNALIHFTPTEYRLLIPILDQASRPVSFKELTRSVLNREMDRDGRRLLDKHIDHIRSKLRPVGLNIHCVARYGYMLLPEE